MAASMKLPRPRRSVGSISENMRSMAAALGGGESQGRRDGNASLVCWYRPNWDTPQKINGLLSFAVTLRLLPRLRRAHSPGSLYMAQHGAPSGVETRQLGAEECRWTAKGPRNSRLPVQDSAICVPCCRTLRPGGSPRYRQLCRGERMESHRFVRQSGRPTPRHPICPRLRGGQCFRRTLAGVFRREYSAMVALGRCGI